MNIIKHLKYHTVLLPLIRPGTLVGVMYNVHIYCTTMTNNSAREITMQPISIYPYSVNQNDKNYIQLC